MNQPTLRRKTRYQELSELAWAMYVSAVEHDKLAIAENAQWMIKRIDKHMLEGGAFENLTAKQRRALSGSF